MLARELAGVTGLPLVHLDREFFGPGWTRPRDEDWQARVDELQSSDRWIIDGTHADTLDRRLRRADGVILLDYSRFTAVRGVFTRLLTRRGRRRADLAPGCQNRLDRDYWNWVWTYRRETHPHIVASLARHADHIDVITLRNRRHAQRWINALRAKPTRGVIDA